MKKRLLSALLALCMCFALLAAGASAAYAPPTEVAAVSVSVPALTVEGGLTIAAVDSSAPYYFGSRPDDWKRVAAEGSAAYAGGLWGEDGSSLVDNSWYMLHVELLLDYGYRYADTVTANVPGAERVEVLRSDDDEISVKAWFKVGTPPETPETISTITLSDLSTVRKDKTGDWTAEIEKASHSDGVWIYDAHIAEWKGSYWSVLDNYTATNSTAVYGTFLTLNALPGYIFADQLTATVNGAFAEITKCGVDAVEVFVPFGNASISRVEVDSDTWPIDGNTIRKDPENFSLAGYDLACTLESAQFQIWDPGISGYRDLKDNETVFSGNESYRVIAVLKAKDYAAFAGEVKGDFNGTGGVGCEISVDGKTCTVTRTCAVYNKAYTYNDDAPSDRINGITIYRDDPAAGKSCVDDALAPTGSEAYLKGATKTCEWYEVPCVGSTTRLKALDENDKFEDGKVYLAYTELVYETGYRFADGFTVAFKQMNGSESNCALTECVWNSAQRKEYNTWYTVGDKMQQEITEVRITGPELENGTIDTSDLSVFQSDCAVVQTARFSDFFNNLYLYLAPKSGCYFGRTVRVIYNGDRIASVSNTYSNPFERKEATVSFDAKPVTVTNITAESKTYDGTTAARLSGTLAGVADGDDVSLDFSGVTAAFEDANAAEDKTVTVKGEVRLAGEDAYKYVAAQPTFENLTATIEPRGVFDDVTDLTQTITTGSDSFAAPRFTGIGGETVEGTIEYNLADGKTEADIPDMLRALKAGEGLYIPYTFEASGNYTGTKTGRITVTAEDAPATYAVRIAESDHGAVSSSRRWAEYGQTVTLTVTPESGYALETLTVTDSRGKELALTDLGGGKYSFRMPSGRVTVTANFLEDNSVLNFFVDVANADYFYESVKWAVENGVTEGVDDTHFDPDGDCTRAQIVTFLWRAAGCPEAAGEVRFADVDPDAYYAKAVAWAIENGVTQGTGETTFSPLRPCTRAEAVTFLARALNAKAEPSAAFDDVDPEAYYAAAVAWAVENGVTEGTGEGTFSPEARCTRAQIVTFLWRAIGK